MNSLSAGGGTPTSAALRLAVTDFPDEATSRTLVLIADGDDGCGDLCLTVQELVSQGVDVTIQAVGIQVGSGAESALTCAANASGGEYFGVDDLDDLADAIGSAVGCGPIKWVAMGDSFSSGEGAAWFYDGTNERGEDNPVRNECRRSDAYASLANQALELAAPEDFLLVACSGARITDVLDDSKLDTPGFQGQYPRSPAGIHGGCRQLEYLLIPGEVPCQGTGPDPSIDVVTLTIGGNDFGFSEILSSCAGFKGPELRLLDGAVPQDVPWLLDFTQVADGRDWIALDQNCESYSHRSLGSFSADVRNNITSLGGDLESLYNEVQASAPNADVYVLSYPMFIPSEFNRAYGDSCGGVAGLDGEERTWLRTITMHANNTIEQAAQRAGVTFVDVEQIEEDMGAPDGANHLICSADPWHHGASTGDEIRGINVPFTDNPDHNRFHRCARLT